MPAIEPHHFFYYVGVLWFSKLILYILNNINSFYLHKEAYKNPTELRYFLLSEENTKLKTRIAALEEENYAITNSIIDNFPIQK
jgi:hypothetical protein